MFKWYGKDVERRINEAAENALEKTAILIENRAKASMTEPKSGAPVPAGQGSRGGRPWQKRQRSAEGPPPEPPAVQTGQLRASITHIKPVPLTRQIGTNVKHGLFTELGTRWMKARPWLRPAFDREKRHFKKFMRGIV